MYSFNIYAEGEPQDPTSLNMIDRKNDENVTATKAYVSSPVGPLRRCLGKLYKT